MLDSSETSHVVGVLVLTSAVGIIPPGRIDIVSKDSLAMPANAFSVLPLIFANSALLLSVWSAPSPLT
jgi:hypothetical protein